MPLYQRLFARIMRAADDAQHEAYAERKRALLGGLRGTVVEIGPGTGVNLRYFEPGIRYVGLEPNPHMHRFLLREAERLGLDVELRPGDALDTGLPDDAADAVVSTLVLCSVPDVAAALAEVRRILKPGGRFVFMEHVAAPRGSGLRRAQRLIRPLWKAAGDGCRPDRETGRLIREAGFAEVEMDALREPAPIPIASPHIAGTAREPARAGSAHDATG